MTESTRYGAPMTMVRGGDDRDLKDIVALGRARAAPFRFHLNRDRDIVHFAIARKRLLAGLGPPGARIVHFFIAEEGASAVAYVVISVQGNEWTIEEAGDRDPGGARLGAILQALIAREPAETAADDQGLAAGRVPAAAADDRRRDAVKDVMMVRPLSDRARGLRPLAPADVVLLAGGRLLRFQI